MEKAPDAFRTISEVAADLDVPQHVLRFWESRFREIKPMKRGGGRRYYRPDDVSLLRGIRHLLYGEGYTIRGVQRIIREQGVKFVQAAGHPVARHQQNDADELIEEVDAPEAVAEAERSRGLFSLLPSLLGDRNERAGAGVCPSGYSPRAAGAARRSGWCRRCRARPAFPARICGGCRPRCTNWPNAADSSTCRSATARESSLRDGVGGADPGISMRQRLTVAAAVLLVAAAGSDAAAQSVEAFYKGNRVSINIGYTPGGVYDIYARTVARHIGKHIPGRPRSSR